MTLALPGQVLLEGFQGFGPELVHRDEQSALLPQQPSRFAGHPDYEAVEVLQLGKFPIKVRQTLHYSASSGPGRASNMNIRTPSNDTTMWSHPEVKSGLPGSRGSSVWFHFSLLLSHL